VEVSKKDQERNWETEVDLGARLAKEKPVGAKKGAEPGGNEGHIGRAWISPDQRERERGGRRGQCAWKRRKGEVIDSDQRKKVSKCGVTILKGAEKKHKKKNPTKKKKKKYMKKKKKNISTALGALQYHLRYFVCECKRI